MTRDQIDKKVKKGLFWAALLRSGGSGLKAIFIIILARILDPHDFGLMAIASMVVFYADNLTSFGFSNALIQRKNLNPEDVNVAFTTNFIISMALCVSCIASSAFISRLFNAPESQKVITIFSLIFLLTTFFDIPITLLKKQINFRASESFRLLRALLQSSIALILALCGWKVWALVYGQLVGLLITSVVVIWYTNWRPHFALSKKSFKDLAHFGVWDFIRNQIGYLGKYGPQFMIGRFVGVDALGLFEKALTATTMVVDQASMNINNIMFSTFSRLQDDEKAIKRTFLHYLTLRTVVGFPVATGFALISPYFVPIVLGNKWNPIIVPIQILCLSEGIRMIGGLLSAANVAIGKYAVHTVYRVITNTILLILCFWFLKWRIVGVALALVAADFLSLIASLKVFWSRVQCFRIGLLVIAIMPATLGCLLMASGFFVLKLYLFSNINIFSMIGLIVCSGALYSLSILGSKQEDILLIKRSIIDGMVKFRRSFWPA